MLSESFCLQRERAVCFNTPVRPSHAVVMGAVKGFWGAVCVPVQPVIISDMTSKHSTLLAILYLPVEHWLTVWVMLTFHISLKTSEFFGSHYFLVTKKNFYQNFRIYLGMYLNMYPMYFLTLKGNTWLSPKLSFPWSWKKSFFIP